MSAPASTITPGGVSTAAAVAPIEQAEAGAEGAQAPAPSAGPSTSMKLKSVALGGLLAGANLAKRGIKAGIAKGKELRADLHETETYKKLKAKLKDAFTILPSGVQAFLSNPTADTILANPTLLFHVAALLNAINHPERAAFEAAVAGSAAVALASSTAQQQGKAPLTSAAALSLAASSGANSVANKFNPAQGSVGAAVVTATTTHLQTVRATGAPLVQSTTATVQQTVGRELTKATNIATSQAIRQFTGINVATNFTQNELHMMATAIKPDDVKTMLRIMNTLYI